MAIISKGMVETKGKKNQAVKYAEKEKPEVDQDPTLTVRDIENLLFLVQQTKLPVGSYPFKELESMNETLNKLKLIYEKLKQMEVLK
tara:strand:- start:89 stop:349 length:261 start_codon:yes stop_codon:yes gene_type:complete